MPGIFKEDGYMPLFTEFGHGQYVAVREESLKKSVATFGNQCSGERNCCVCASYIFNRYAGGSPACGKDDPVAGTAKSMKCRKNLGVHIIHRLHDCPIQIKEQGPFP